VSRLRHSFLSESNDRRARALSEFTDGLADTHSALRLRRFAADGRDRLLSVAVQVKAAQIAQMTIWPHKTGEIPQVWGDLGRPREG